MLQAIDRFDPLRGVSFRAFAGQRIKGSILDGISHSSEDAAYFYRSRSKTIERATSFSGDNVNEESALSRLSDIVVGLAIGYIIDEESSNATREAVDYSANAYETMAWKELKASIFKNVDNLPERENVVVKRHYFQGLAFKQIAIILQVTKGRVSQIHKSAINILRKRMKSRNG